DGAAAGLRRERGRRDVPAAVVGQRLVNFITYHIQIVADSERHDLPQLLGAEHGADGVPGAVEQQDAAAGREGLAQGAGVEAVTAAADIRPDADRPAAPECDDTGVGVVDGVRQQDFVAGLNQYREGGRHAAGGAVGDEDLAVGV